jgi:hypothetical protein
MHLDVDQLIFPVRAMAGGIDWRSQLPQLVSSARAPRFSAQVFLTTRLATSKPAAWAVPHHRQGKANLAVGHHRPDFPPIGVARTTGMVERCTVGLDWLVRLRRPRAAARNVRPHAHQHSR